MKYPPRDKGTDVQQFGYLCTCGHYKHNHRIGFYFLALTKCEECMCPKYIPDKTLDENNKPKTHELKK